LRRARLWLAKYPREPGYWGIQPKSLDRSN